MWEDFLNHTCNVYRPETETINPGFGMAAQERLVPGTVPLYTDVPCHFNVKGDSTVIVQGEHFAVRQGNDKLAFGSDADIRENDLVVKVVGGTETGLKYRVVAVHDIHGHHQTAELQRPTVNVEAAI